MSTQHQQDTMVSVKDLVSDLQASWTEIRETLERGQSPSGAQISSFDQVVSGLYGQISKRDSST